MACGVYNKKMIGFSLSEKELLSFWQHHDQQLVVSRETVTRNISLTHDLYRGMPASFNRFFAFWQEHTIRHLIQVCPPHPGAWVLDLGCGTGRWSSFLQRSYRVQTVGIDVGIQALTLARLLTPSGNWVAMAIPQLGFCDESFDWVISVTVLQHLPHPFQEIALREIRRLLHPNGKAIILELCRPAEPGFYLFSRSQREWQNLFDKLGFLTLRSQVYERLPWIPLLRWLARRKYLRKSKKEEGVIEDAAQWFKRSLWPWIGLYLFLAFAYPLETLATVIRWSPWARYTGWLLQKRSK